MGNDSVACGFRHVGRRNQSRRDLTCWHLWNWFKYQIATAEQTQFITRVDDLCWRQTGSWFPGQRLGTVGAVGADAKNLMSKVSISRSLIKWATFQALCQSCHFPGNMRQKQCRSIWTFTCSSLFHYFTMLRGSSFKPNSQACCGNTVAMQKESRPWKSEFPT